MSNLHLRESRLSLKSKGLLSIMLSLPDEWEYSIAGLASLSKDGKDSVMSALDELCEFGYIKMTSIRNDKGQFETIYDIYEEPILENQCGKSNSDNQPQLNTNNIISTDSRIINTPTSKNNKELKSSTPLLLSEVSPSRGKQTDGLDLSFIAASFRPAIDIWLEYKKERKQSYKQKGLEALYHKLVNLSNGDPHTAMLIVEQSMANNYQGLFELKGGNNGNPASRPTDAQMLRAAIDQSWGPGGDPLADIL